MKSGGLASLHTATCLKKKKVHSLHSVIRIFTLPNKMFPSHQMIVHLLWWQILMLNLNQTISLIQPFLLHLYLLDQLPLQNMSDYQSDVILSSNLGEKRSCILLSNNVPLLVKNSDESWFYSYLRLCVLASSGGIQWRTCCIAWRPHPPGFVGPLG